VAISIITGKRCGRNEPERGDPSPRRVQKPRPLTQLAQTTQPATGKKTE
jgi:hypothetical protein